MIDPRLYRCALVLLSLLTGACSGDDDLGDDTQPPPGGAALVPGDTADFILPPGPPSAAHEYKPESGAEVALYAEIVEGKASVMVQTPGITEDLSLEEGLPLLARRSSIRRVNGGSLMRVTVKRVGAGTVRYRLFLYPLNRAPETVPAAYVLGTAITEPLYPSADIDEFTVEGAAGDEWLGFFDAPLTLEGFPWSLDQAAVLRPNGEPFGAIVGTGKPFGEESTPLGPLNASGTHRIRVTASSGQAAPVPYQLAVHKLNRGPERAAAVRAIGDSITGEAIDLPGDVDTFTITGTAGQLFTVFIEVPSDSGPRSISVSLAGVAPGPGALDGPPLWRSGRSSMPASGEVTLQLGGPRTSYRALVRRVDPGPETAPATLSLPGTVTGEQLDMVTDLDEFTLNVPTRQAINVLLSRPQSSDRPSILSVARVGAGPDSVAELLRLYAQDNSQAGSGWSVFPAGTWKLRVSEIGFLDPLHFTGPYELQVHPLDSLPEGVPAALQLGVPVNEGITPLGDRDRFTFDGTAGQLVRLSLAQPGSPAQPVISAELGNVMPQYPGLNPVLAAASVLSPGPVVELPMTATYPVEVNAGGGQMEVGDRGPYVLRVDPVSTTPETGPGTITVGGAAVGESLEPHDVDDYMVQGVANGEITVLLSHDATRLCAEVLHPTTPERLGGTWSYGRVSGSGAIRLGDDGRARVRVWGPGQYMQSCPLPPDRRSSGATRVNNYQLQVRAVDRAPETLPAAVAVGDTTLGESIDYISDVDEFTVAGVAGQLVVPSLRTVSSFDGADFLTLTLVAPDGTVLTTFQQLGSGWWMRGTPVQLPVTGTYTTRIRPVGGWQGTGAYEFVLATE